MNSASPFFAFETLLIVLLGCAAKSVSAEPTRGTRDYSSVDLIFKAHCMDCHGTQDPEAGLVLETHQDLAKGGESGPVIVPRKSADSLLVQMVEGRFEKDGKKKIMPPGKRKKLTPEEIATIRAWIDAGASAPAGPLLAKELHVPKIAPKLTPRNPVNALALPPKAAGRKDSLIAVGRYGAVELRAASSLALLRTLERHKGNVNALCFSADGSRLFAAGGQPALAGEIKVWEVADGKLLATLEGHKDAIYSLALSPDGRMLATGSYDQKIKLWDTASGKELKTLSGHNGCIYRLAFRPDGKLLASASADRTVKLWDVDSGERRDTLSQSLKELYALAFSPDGTRLAAGGSDNRIRVWQISETAKETTDPMLYSKFGHEGAILNLAYSEDGALLVSSADDRTVKLWDAAQMTERLVLPPQSDWPVALGFLGNTQILVGRIDGTLSLYDESANEIASVSGDSAVSAATQPGKAQAQNTALKQKENVP